MYLRPEHYYRAALERMEQAHVLYRQGSSYALAMYVAGVAAECMLRAFKLRKDPTLDEKHDLLRLFKASGMLEVDRVNLRGLALPDAVARTYSRDLQVWINEVSILWLNTYRYASEDRLRAHLKKTGRLRERVKGDVLKASARRLIDATQKLINRGFQLWGRSTEKFRSS